MGMKTNQIKNCTSNQVGTSTNLRNCTNIVVIILCKPKIVLTFGLRQQPIQLHCTNIVDRIQTDPTFTLPLVFAIVALQEERLLQGGRNHLEIFGTGTPTSQSIV